MRKAILVPIMLAALVSGCKTAVVYKDNLDKTVTLKQLQHGWVIINYWDTWCHACKEEIPMFNKFYRANKSKTQLYGVNYSGLIGEKLQKAMNVFHFKFPVLQQNPAADLHLPGMEVVPTTFILHDGKLVKTLQGPQNAKSLEESSSSK